MTFIPLGLVVFPLIATVSAQAAPLNRPALPTRSQMAMPDKAAVTANGTGNSFRNR